MELYPCDEMSVQPLCLSYTTKLHYGESSDKVLSASLPTSRSIRDTPEGLSAPLSESGHKRDHKVYAPEGYRAKWVPTENISTTQAHI